MCTKQQIESQKGAIETPCRVYTLLLACVATQSPGLTPKPAVFRQEPCALFQAGTRTEYDMLCTNRLELRAILRSRSSIYIYARNTRTQRTKHKKRVYRITHAHAIHHSHAHRVHHNSSKRDQAVNINMRLVVKNRKKRRSETEAAMATDVVYL